MLRVMCSMLCVIKYMETKILKILEQSQQNEITEYLVYKKLAKTAKNKQNQEVLNRIAEDELDHYNFFRKYTKKTFKSNKKIVWKYYIIAKIFGLTFGLKLMEKGEATAQINYEKLIKDVPDIKGIIHDEDNHEKALISLINEEKLKYMGSIVLGLNDALVELLGTLAGLTFALQNNQLIALAGLITGIAASLSMGSSEYLVTRSEKTAKHPIKSAIYTTIAYFLTTAALVLPYFILNNFYYSLGWAIGNAVIIIFIFNYYLSIVRDLNFKKRFLEMIFVSLGVAALSFGIGYLARLFLGEV